MWCGGRKFPVPARTIHAWQDEADVRAHVLVEDHRLLGYGELSFDPAENEVELARIIVSPPARGRGVGVSWFGACSPWLWKRAFPMSSCASTRTTRRRSGVTRVPGSNWSTPLSQGPGTPGSRSTTCGSERRPLLFQRRSADASLRGRKGPWVSPDPRHTPGPASHQVWAASTTTRSASLSTRKGSRARTPSPTCVTPS